MQFFITVASMPFSIWTFPSLKQNHHSQKRTISHWSLKSRFSNIHLSKSKNSSAVFPTLSRLIIAICRFLNRLPLNFTKWICWKIITWMKATLCFTCRLRKSMLWKKTWKNPYLQAHTILHKYRFTFQIRQRLISKKEWTYLVSVSATTIQFTYLFTRNIQTFFSLSC